MSFLQNNQTEYISARITNKGRQKIAEGNFNISYFQVGDSEYDYGMPVITGTTQKIFIPLDKDSTIKYPYKFSDLSTTGTTFGNPIRSSQVETLKNQIPDGTGWTLNNIWTTAPITITDNVSGFTSSLFASTKEFLGYTSSKGQSTNTGTTITNSMNEKIIISPEEQHSIAIIHYTGLTGDTEDFFKYEDYIAHNDIIDSEYFELELVGITYNRTTGTTFYMDTEDYYINSGSIDTKENKIKFRYLIDSEHNNVGKIFVNHKIIVIDDQELVAVLDTGSNRTYTLPIPRVSQIPFGSNCDINVTSALMNGVTGETVFVSYYIESDKLPCNSYGMVTGTSLNANIMLTFSDEDIAYLTGNTIGTTLTALYQKVDAGEIPTPDGWVKIVFPTYSSTNTFIIGESSQIPSITGLGTFGEEISLPGTVKLTRGSDLQVMRFLIPLPSNEFETTQNPTWISGVKRVTEIGLLDSNKDVLVIGKIPNGIIRTGSQVFAVKIDI